MRSDLDGAREVPGREQSKCDEEREPHRARLDDDRNEGAQPASWGTEDEQIESHCQRECDSCCGADSPEATRYLPRTGLDDPRRLPQGKRSGEQRHERHCDPDADHSAPGQGWEDDEAYNEREGM